MPKPPELLTFDHYSTPYQAENGYKHNHDSSKGEGEKVLSWWDSFSKAVIGISTFGASITFSVILSSLPDPVDIRSTSTSKISRNTKFGRETVRKFLSISWLMFVLALGFAIVSQLMLRKASGYGKGLKLLQVVLNWLILGAFMFLSLAVAAYVPEVGWVGVGFISFFALLVSVLWCSGEV
jgi:hypothetical protein